MPTVLRIGPYRFHFYSREGTEPPHIHVARDDFEAKFWLQPVGLPRLESWLPRGRTHPHPTPCRRPLRHPAPELS